MTPGESSRLFILVRISVSESFPRQSELHAGANSYWSELQTASTPYILGESDLRKSNITLILAL